jgi:hypothetical protein
MKKTVIIIALISCFNMNAQTKENPLVNIDTYEKLVKVVKDYRKNRLVPLAEFKKMSLDTNTIILDTRSSEMYAAKHIKGAVHLNFSDFTMETLRRVVPNKNTKILIYCNNNIANDPIHFASKTYVRPNPFSLKKDITLALNIPTFINLYGYDYKNIFELADLISVFSKDLEFEGDTVQKLAKN